MKKGSSCLTTAPGWFRLAVAVFQIYSQIRSCTLAGVVTEAWLRTAALGLSYRCEEMQRKKVASDNLQGHRY